MALQGSPRKRARLVPPGNADEISNDSDLFNDIDQRVDDVDDEDDVVLASQPQARGWQSWSVENVAQQLLDFGIPEGAVQKFRDHEIDGSVLSQLTEDHMKDSLDIQELGIRLKIQGFLKTHGLENFDTLHADGSKVFNDPVHGHMELHPLCVAIIDTPQFQRLRYLKQLGVCYFVYPGAAHNRFEHCLGVCHLAGKLAEALRRRQPGLGITNRDILCIQVAGLCHDLGHGPFSHLFDGIFIPTTRPDKKKWAHEEASIAMFDHLVKVNKLEAVFEQYQITEKERTFIKEQIAGKPLTGTDTEKKTWYYGRKKAFLYEIVANKRNGVDVDKWDYFRRDCHHLGISSSFDHTRFIQFSRVIRVDGELQICVRDKEVFNMYEMFHTRHALHRRAYQHKAVQAVEIMLVKAMVIADEYIRIPGDDGKEYKISECIDHMDGYTNLNDTVFHLILLSRDPRLQEARDILRDIQRRKLYKCVGETVPITDSVVVKKESEIREEILKELSDKDAQVKALQVDTSRFEVQLVRLDFGKKEKNPVDDLRFFTKDQQNDAVPFKASDVSSMVPQAKFKEQLVRVFLRPTEDDAADKQRRDLLLEGFKKWCKKNQLKEPKEMAGIIASPYKGRQENGTVTPARSASPLTARPDVKSCQRQLSKEFSV